MKSGIGKKDLALGITLGLIVGMILIGGLVAVGIYVFPEVFVDRPPPPMSKF